MLLFASNREFSNILSFCYLEISMGNSSPEQPITYSTLKKELHPILGPLSIVSVAFSSSPQLCLLKHRSQLDVQATNRQISWLMGKENNHACKYVLKKIYAQPRQQTSSCSQLQQQELFFEKYQQDLQLQYYSKKTNGLNFSQQQMLKIIHDCTLALRLTEELNMKFYHLSKQSIFQHKNGNYMLTLAEDAEAPHPMEIYRQEFKEDVLGKTFYLSPQLLNCIEQDEHQPVTTKDQLFSLGATLLSLAQMKDLQFESQIIGVVVDGNQKQYTFEEKRIRKQVEKLRLLATGIEYSDRVKKLIRGMLEYQREQRISVEEIITEVGEFQRNVKIHRVNSARKLSATKDSGQHNKTLSTNKSIHKRAMSTAQSKKVIDVYLDAKHLFEDAKQVTSKISMDAKTYKNAKMNKFRLQNHPHKEVVSQFTSKQSQFTPIKQLSMSPFSPFSPINQIDMFSQALSLPRTESRYEYVSQNTIKTPGASKTSIAMNMISQHPLDPCFEKMRFKMRQ